MNESEMQYTAIHGVHTNILTCGIARFNSEIAQELNVPSLPLFDRNNNVLIRDNSIVSTKDSEFATEQISSLSTFLSKPEKSITFTLFLHHYHGSHIDKLLIDKASCIVAANSLIFDNIGKDLVKTSTPLISLFCPGRLGAPLVPVDTEITRIFTFGMAHKIDANRYRKLKSILDNTFDNYCVYMSTAVHEGYDIGDSFESAQNQLAALFQDKLQFVGFASDSLLSMYLNSCDYFVAFFRDGLLENNTSVFAAMNAGCVVISNLTPYSPKFFRHMENIIDIGLVKDELLVTPKRLTSMRTGAKKLAEKYSFNELATKLLSIRIS